MNLSEIRINFLTSIFLEINLIFGQSMRVYKYIFSLRKMAWPTHPQQDLHILHQPQHLLLRDRAVIVHIKDTENLQ